MEIRRWTWSGPASASTSCGCICKHARNHALTLSWQTQWFEHTDSFAMSRARAFESSCGTLCLAILEGSLRDAPRSTPVGLATRHAAQPQPSRRVGAGSRCAAAHNHYFNRIESPL